MNPMLSARVSAVLLLTALAPALAWANCGVSTSGVAFGAYDPFAAQHLDSAGTISVSCDAPTAYTIALSTGSGSFALRTLLSGAHQLGYNLYVDPARTIVWGDGSASTSTVPGNDSGAVHTVYGRIPARQNVHIGSYSDSLVITVSF